MLRDVVARAKGKPSKTGLKEALAFLTKHHVPPAIVRKLQACAIARPIQVGSFVLYPLASLPKENGRENRRALANGFLVMGRGATGDPVAVELKTGQVAFLSHDTLSGFDPETTRFEECVARSSLGIGEFWKRAMEQPDFPRDFYEAGGA